MSGSNGKSSKGKPKGAFKKPGIELRRLEREARKEQFDGPAAHAVSSAFNRR